MTKCSLCNGELRRRLVGDSECVDCGAQYDWYEGFMLSERWAVSEIERLQGIVDKSECLQAVVMEITDEMASIDSLTGLRMRENTWREKLREAVEAEGGE